MSKPHKRHKSRVKFRSGLPKGAIRVPSGGVLLPASSTMFVRESGATEQIVVQGLMRDEPDLKKIARVLLDLARDDPRSKPIRARPRPK